MPFTIKNARDSNKIGVKNLPIISITLVGFIVSKSVIEKNITENKTGLKFFASGNILISNVVAPVLGITNIGPRHNIIKNSKVIPNFLPALPITFWRLPALEIAIIDNKIIPTSANMKPKKLINQLLPEEIPIYGGNIKFPAPKNIENRANPIIKISLFLFIINPLFLIIYKVYAKRPHSGYYAAFLPRIKKAT